MLTKQRQTNELQNGLMKGPPPPAYADARITADADADAVPHFVDEAVPLMSSSAQPSSSSSHYNVTVETRDFEDGAVISGVNLDAESATAIHKNDGSDATTAPTAAVDGEAVTEESIRKKRRCRRRRRALMVGSGVGGFIVGGAILNGVGAILGCVGAVVVARKFAKRRAHLKKVRASTVNGGDAGATFPEVSEGGEKDVDGSDSVSVAAKAY